jgi:hypothetical protein
MEEKFQLPAGYFKNTFCVFKEILPPNFSNKKFDYISKSGSSYYFTKLGMYRLSNHWGRLANSKWRLVSLDVISESKFKWGYAPWESFFPDNSIDQLYFIQPDFFTNTVNYQHKNAPDFDNKAVLRTSLETAKKIKQIRNLMNLTSWAKYFDYEDIDVLRYQIIQKLIYTNQTLEDIKRDLL